MKKCLLILGILVSSLFLTSQAFARCGYGGCYSSCYSTYVTPTIVPVQVPFAYPILVPAFQFQYVPPTYIPSAVPVVAATAFNGYPGAYIPGVNNYGTPTPAYGIGGASYGYPGVNNYGTPTPAYGIGGASYGYPGVNNYGTPTPAYGIGGASYGYPGQQSPITAQYPGQPMQNYNPQQTQQDRIRELARALLEEMNKQAGTGGAEDQGPPPVPGLGQPQYNTQPQGQPQGYSQPPQPQQNNQQLQQVAFSAFSRTCATCHTGIGSKHSIQIFTSPGIVNPNAPWRKMKDEINRGAMPPKDSQFQLTPNERQAIEAWFRSIGVN